MISVVTRLYPTNLKAAKYSRCLEQQFEAWDFDDLIELKIKAYGDDGEGQDLIQEKNYSCK